MSSGKCPNCGASTLTIPYGGSSQREVVVSCTYCNSRFSVNNPYYQPPVQEVRHTYNTTNYINYGPDRPRGWRYARDREHKFAKIAGYVIAILMIPFVLGIWIGYFLMAEPYPVFLPIGFTGFMLLFYLLASASDRELKRRKREGISY
ncbi:hypothetical protein [Chitinophaga varians]|uniref:hypothetical protein n=1 Tax=Chitinophaga varians TaxID=2202339 RepID=UPI00165FF8A6|nr:hypothetical protein [Chitinophaga varians]MBC9912604.1 hypothetical protein [Chitinophaga varians]